MEYRAGELGATVLLAEDNLVNQEVAEVQLNKVGLVVAIAENGLQAVAMARKTRYDLILMDVQMPKLDGHEATRQIRADSMNSDVPILAMTANAFAEDRRACLEAGMDDFVAKPVMSEELYTRLLRWLSDPGRQAP